MHDSLKSGEIDLAAPSDAHDAQLSNGPIGASIRVREVPIQQCQRLTSHSTQHTALELRERGKGAFTVGVVAVEVGTYPGGSGYAVGLTRR